MSSRITSAARWLALVVLYVAAAKVGFRAAFVAEQVSPVWPPTGLALWAVLEFGPSFALPAIWIGAFTANATTNEPGITAAIIATGNTLEAFAGASLLRRFGGVDRSLETLRHVTTLVAAAALTSTGISATIGVSALCVAGLQPWARFASLWWIWWLGDASGALLVAPLLLTLRSWRRAAVSRTLELVTLELLTIAVTIVVFGVRVTGLTGHPPLEYTVFPLVIWAGLRFAHPGAALVSATVSTIAVWGTLNGTGPFTASWVGSAHESIILLQIFTAVIATSALVFGAAIADRNRSERLRTADHALTTILAGGPDLKSAAAPMLKAVCETLGWDVGVLWRTNDVRLELVDSWQRDDRLDEFIAASRSLQYTRGLGLPGRVWASGRPESISDVVIDPDFPRAPVARRVGLHSGFAFPILLGPNVLGVMEFFARQPRQVDSAVSALMAAAGAQVGQFIERKRIEDERAMLLARERDARAQAEHANRAKDQFLATISHELRTPLTAILGWTSMLRSRKFDRDRLEEIHESIYRNAEMQAQLVNDLLDVSRIVTGQLRLDLQPTDVCEVARSSLETIRPTAAAKRVRVSADLPSEPCIVSADAARLQQVIWNLLSNAIKFTPSDGRVKLAVHRNDSTVVIQVTDSGIGLTGEALKHVFERFWQADSTTTREHGGLGLGLALVRHIVELHGGDVSAASKGHGRGSTFTVTLPAPSGSRRAASRYLSPSDSTVKRSTK